LHTEGKIAERKVRSTQCNRMLQFKIMSETFHNCSMYAIGILVAAEVTSDGVSELRNSSTYEIRGQKVNGTCVVSLFSLFYFRCSEL
jgi:hypothetical protein